MYVDTMYRNIYVGDLHDYIFMYACVCVCVCVMQSDLG